MSGTVKREATSGTSTTGPASPAEDGSGTAADAPETELLAEVPPWISEDELFDVLSNRRRRLAITLLRREDAPVELGRMADEIAARENDVPVEEVSAAQRKRVYTALQQTHLPRMDRAGLVAFDREVSVVEPASGLSSIELYPDVVSGRDVAWSEYYLALSAVGVALLVGARLGVGPLSLLPDFAWATFVVVAFGFSSLAHRYYARRIPVGAARTGR